MLTIDWGDLRPTQGEREALEARLARVEQELGMVCVRRMGSGYEARLRLPVRDRSTELRLHGDEIADTIERLAGLLEIVASERRRIAH